MNPYVKLNREMWNTWTEIHHDSAFYDVAGFIAAPPPFDDVIRGGLPALAGKSVLHLQCHFGMDTLRLAREARTATGIDLSPRAIERARALSEATGIAARFIETDLYALPDVLDEQFDVVFTSYGVLGWLPDLARWGEIVARYLAPGGQFFLAEGHPLMFALDPESDDIRVKYPYFHTPEPIAVPNIGTYAEPASTVETLEHSWPFGIGDTVTALLAAGLRIDALREHDVVAWKGLPYLVGDRPGMWRMPADRPSIPLMFSINASKPR